MKSMSTAEIVSIADTFKLADDVLIPYRVGDKFGFCDKDRNIVIEPKYTMATPFSNGYAGVVIKPEDALHTVAGYINKKGEMITGFEYTFIEPFLKDERAIVRNLGAQYGIINTAGEYVVPAVFDLIEYRPDLGLYLVRADGKYGLVDKDNNVKLPVIYDHFLTEPDSRLIRVIKDDKWGVLDYNLETILGLEYDNVIVSPESDNIFYVEKEGVKSVITANKQKLLEITEYTTLTYLNENIAISQIAKSYFEANWGLIDIHTGKEILPCEYSIIRGSKHGVLTLQIAQEGGGDKYGLINEKGEFIIQPEYDFILIYEADFIFARKGSDYYVFNADGQVILKPEYDPSYFSGTRECGLLRYKNGSVDPHLVGIMDKRGKVVIEPKYETLYATDIISYQFVLVERGGSSFYIDLKGNEYYE